MITVTSAQANKLLNKLNDDVAALYRNEQQCARYIAAVGEQLEDARPEYDFETVRIAIATLEEKVRIVKHAINVFNTTTEVPETGMTIDQVLVLIPQYTKSKARLADMKSKLPKERQATGIRTGTIEYMYANYSINAAKAAYDDVTAKLANIQNALDTVNNTVTFTIDVDI